MLLSTVGEHKGGDHTDPQLLPAQDSPIHQDSTHVALKQMKECAGFSLVTTEHTEFYFLNQELCEHKHARDKAQELSAHRGGNNNNRNNNSSHLRKLTVCEAIPILFTNILSSSSMFTASPPTDLETETQRG